MIQKKIKSRETLKGFFKKGKRPEESDFEYLIDSTFNKVDDKIDVTDEEGLRLHKVENGQFISFYDSEDRAAWELRVLDSEKGLSFKKNENNMGVEKPFSALALTNAGKIGIGTESPEEKLDVRGLISSAGRIGNFKQDTCPADGCWHNIFEAGSLPPYSAFEIMASAQDEFKKEDRQALLHATAICVSGTKNSKITRTSAFYGRRWNRIEIRWESRSKRLNKPKNRSWIDQVFDFFEGRGKTFNLQIRTHSNYGNDSKIHFKVTKLWDQERFTENDPITKNQQETNNFE